MKESIESTSEKLSVSLIICSLISGIITALTFTSGIIFVPITSALLAALVLSDRGKRITSLCISISLILLDFVLNGIFSLSCLHSVLLAFVIFYTFTHSDSKAECVVYSTVITSMFIFLSLYTSAAMITGSFSFDSVCGFYKGLIEDFSLIMRDFVIEIESIESSGSSVLSADGVEDYIGYLIDLLPSMIGITAFFITGLTLKLFSAISKRTTAYEPRLKVWRFSSSRLFVIFYLVLILLSLTGLGNEDLLSIALVNLYSVFMAVFAYLGFKHTVEILALRFNSIGVARILLIVAICIFSSVAIQILSYLGAFMEFIIQKVPYDTPRSDE